MTVHLSVPKHKGEETIRELRRISCLDDSFEIQRDGECLHIPVRKECSSSLDYLGTVTNLSPMERKRKPLPEGIKGSYDVIGSIVIMKRSNVRDPVTLAGNLLKRPGIESVFLDSGIHGPNRVRTLKLLAGKDSKATTYRENGIVLKVDVEKAYFSPRLATERMLVANSIKDGDFVIDMFAGIGPFSVLIAKNRKCRVVAIDHNEAAIELLKENIRINTLKGEIVPVLGDSGTETGKYRNSDRIIMNLPRGAAPFLGKAVEALKPGGRINFYEVSTVDGIERRMEELRGMGLHLVGKREVHGYSRDEFMYSLEAASGKE